METQVTNGQFANYGNYAQFANQAVPQQPINQVMIPQCGIDGTTQMDLRLKDGTYLYSNASISDVKKNVNGNDYFWLNMEMDGALLSFYSRKVLTEDTEGKLIPVNGSLVVKKGRFVEFRVN